MPEITPNLRNRDSSVTDSKSPLERLLNRLPASVRISVLTLFALGATACDEEADGKSVVTTVSSNGNPNPETTTGGGDSNAETSDTMGFTHTSGETTGVAEHTGKPEGGTGDSSGASMDSTTVGEEGTGTGHNDSSTGDVEVDNTPPGSPQITTNSGQQMGPTPQEAKGGIDISGITTTPEDTYEMLYSIDGMPFIKIESYIANSQDWVEKFIFDDVEVPHTICFQAKDKAGNVSIPQGLTKDCMTVKVIE